MISVTIHKPDVVLGGQWDDLVSRSQPNVFMNPAALKAAADTMFAVIHVLLAWETGLDEPRLIGLWALQERRAFPFWPKVLEGLPYEYAFLSNPVVDRAFVTQVIPAFLAAIADAPTLPDVVALRSLDGEAATCGALLQELTQRGGRFVTLKSESRPYAARESFARQTGERAKKLRQNWRRLNETGPAEVSYLTTPADVCSGLEAFLTLEHRSWKGAAGTALLCRETDAAFARRLMALLAERGEAAVYLLRVGGRAIAAQVILFSGSVALTWKTAFDEDYARFSPGVTLIDRSIDDLFATAGIAEIDSCSIEGSFMGKICTGRRTMLDLLIDVGPRQSPVFALESVRLRGRERLKQIRDRARRAWATPTSDKQPSKAEQGAAAATSRQPSQPATKRSAGTVRPIRVETSPPLASEDARSDDSGSRTPTQAETVSPRR